MDNFERWNSAENLDAELRAELDSLSCEEIEERFYRNISFGTGGMRGKMGVGTNRMNIYMLRKAAKGFADYINAQNGADKGVAIAYDNRRNSELFARTVAGVLAAEGVKSYLFESLRTTPELSYAVRKLGLFGGAVVTASHNPPEYNGFKLYDETGCQMVLRYTDEVIKYINSVPDELAVVCLEPSETDLIEYIGEEIDESYYAEVKKISLHPELDKSNLTVCYSPLHGTGNIPVRRILGDLGYRVAAVEEQCVADSEFSKTPDPNPENPAAFKLPIEVAKKASADIIICTDPDCDRLGIAVLDKGEYVIMNANQTGAVLLEYILSERKKQGTIPSNGVILNSIVTSGIGDKIAEAYGLTTEKTLTGFKFIGDKIHDHEVAKDKQFVFAYEESYGYLISDIVRDKDGVQSSMMIAEAAAFYKAQGRTLLDVLGEVYEKYGFVKDCQTAVKLEGMVGREKIKAIMSRLRTVEMSELEKLGVISVEDYKENTPEGFPKSDVLRFILKDGGFCAVRPSGTEPKCKFYYSIIAKTPEAAEEKYEQLKAVIEQIPE